MADEDIFRILLSTDNHLGYLEKDLIRGSDSFITFEEILAISQNIEPDFVLLGGDLFHDNKPSMSSLFKCTELLRKYTLKENPIKFKIVSDQSTNFSHSDNFPHSNFNDQNLNVGMPIFTIHGNHDDPIDQTNLCALDLFHASGLVNLFGKSSSIESIVIQPILLRKGKTKLALYGLGAIRNERLHRLFQQKKVHFERPKEDPDDWFSIFVIHQNRVKHGATNYIPENFLPSFLDLVYWGHEHDCRLSAEYNVQQQFYVSQPGSSVATSLCEGEATPKYVGLLSVVGKDFKIDKIKLKTVRPFVIDSIVLEDEDELVATDPRVADKVERFCEAKLADMLTDVAQLISGHENQPQLPLVRLSVDYSGGFDMFSLTRFSQKFVAIVANPKDMLVLHRKRELASREALGATGFVLEVGSVKHDVGLDGARVEDLVMQQLAQGGDSDGLGVLNVRKLSVGVKFTVDKDEKDILDKVVVLQTDTVEEHLKRKNVGEQAVLAEIERFRDFQITSWGENDEEDEEEYIKNKLRLGSTAVVSAARGKAVKMEMQEYGAEDDGEDEEDRKPLRKAAATRGRGGKRATAAAASSSMMYETMELDDDDEEADYGYGKKPAKRGGAARGRGGRSAADKRSVASVNSSSSMADSQVSMMSEFSSNADLFRKRKAKATAGDSVVATKRK